MKQILLTLFGLTLIGVYSFGQNKTTGIKFDGVDDYVLIPDGPQLNLGRMPFTIEAWIQADTNNNSTLAPMVLSKKKNGAGSLDGFLFGLDDKGHIAMQLRGVNYTGGGGFGGPGVPASDLRDNQCHHIAWTREVGGVEDTVNGYQDAAYVKKTRQEAGTDSVWSNGDLWVGWSDFNGVANIYQFSGLIKEVRIWNFAKTESEIFTGKNVHMVGNEPGLIAYWRMNEGFADTVYDCSGNMNHGTLQNGAAYGTFCDVLDALPSTCVPDTTDTTDTSSSIIQYGNWEAGHQYLLYPNPVVNVLNLRSEQPIERILIYDLNGKAIMDKAWDGRSSLAVSGLKPGTYLAQLSYRGQAVYRAAFAKE